MKLGIPKEQTPEESRVALVPQHVPGLLKRGYEVLVEKNAGIKAGYSDEAYKDKGAHIADSFEVIVKEVDIVLSVRAGKAASNGKDMASLLKEGQIIIGLMEPYSKDEAFDTFLRKKVSAFSMELIPRTTRAQSMDVLSSMANLAGYKSVLIGANQSLKMFPMMMTAAGTITPANVFVLGVGVAGLQAIATAKRLGAVVNAYYIRSEVKEQVESLGAKFASFDLESGEGEGGYAKEMDDTFYKRQREMMMGELSEKDVVITTANIPGKKAPILITEEMVKAMPEGSVIVDLASERGGNCELSEAGKIVKKHGVTIVGPTNVAANLPFNASQLYSKNITTFLYNLFNKEEATINFNDDIVAATALTHQGAVVSEKVKTIIGGDQT